MARHCTCSGEPSQYCARCEALLARAEGRVMPADVNALFHGSSAAQEQRSSSGETPFPWKGGEPEQRLLDRVRTLAREQGWLCYHTRDSRRSEAGFPDVVCTNGVRIVIVELKSDTGKLTQAQAQWIALLSHTGLVDVRVWKPGDWPEIYAYFTQGTPTTQHDNADTVARAQQGFPRAVRRFFHEDD